MKELLLGIFVISLATSASAGCIGPVVGGTCRGTYVDNPYVGAGSNDSTRYRGSSGAEYQYDLSSPSDRNRYSVDIGAQLRDGTSVDIRRDLDRSRGQYGGGSYSD